MRSGYFKSNDSYISDPKRSCKGRGRGGGRRYDETSNHRRYNHVSYEFSNSPEQSNSRPKSSFQSSSTFGRKSEADQSIRELLGWRDNPTLGWLASPNRIRYFPKLDNYYQYAESYMENLLKVWTHLTFYWGTGAVWPKCHSDCGGKICNEPLFIPATEGSCSQCHGSCGERLLWKCYRRSHQMLCDECLRALQIRLYGTPGPFASTDIYDALIEKVELRKDFTVYIAGNLKSRKPPTIATNWKTSYRLKSAGFVGVIRLKSQCQNLSPKSKITWGEIVPYNSAEGSDGDYKFRQNGKLAFRIIGQNDFSSFHVDADVPFSIDEPIAVIDMRVFVPEVLTVLFTLTKDDFVENLHEISFLEQILGHSSKASKIPTFLLDSATNLYNTIRQIIFTSELKLFAMLPDASKEKIAHSIYQIPAVQTLYGKQLEAFALGLGKSVHCTQGPPGTGKSYVGVVLTSALIIIKKHIEKTGRRLGPILVLSYKNHALDEFLEDLLKSRRDLIPGKLIRVGRSESEVLNNYGQHRTKEEYISEEELMRRISLVQNLFRVSKIWDDSCVALNITADSMENDTCMKNQDKWKRRNTEKDCVFHIETYVLADILSLMEIVSNSLEMSTPDLSCVLKHLRGTDIYEKPVPDISQPPFLNDLEYWPNSLPSPHPCEWDDVLYHLEMWIQGFNPPPKCQYEYRDNDTNLMHNCSQSCNDGFIFCQWHKCSNLDCNMPRLHKYLYCKNHKCQYEDGVNNICHEPTMKNLDYCEHHICPGVKYFCRNCKDGEYACSQHQCIAVDSNKLKCSKLQLDPFSFCEDHVCLSCIRLPSNGNGLVRCLNSHYCVEHKCRSQNCSALKFQSLNIQSAFCAKHSCVLCADQGRDIQCVDVISGTKVCDNHRCHHQDRYCKLHRWEKSDFCLIHTCRYCLSCGAYASHDVTDELPRNSCINHVMCAFVYRNGTLCNLLATAGENYCINHPQGIAKSSQTTKATSRPGFCAGINSKKKPCGAKALSNDRLWYCDAHIGQRKDFEENAPVDTYEKHVQQLLADNRLRMFVPIPESNSAVADATVECAYNFRFSKCRARSLRIDQDQEWLCNAHSRSSNPLEDDNESVFGVQQVMFEAHVVEGFDENLLKEPQQEVEEFGFPGHHIEDDNDVPLDELNIDDLEDENDDLRHLREILSREETFSNIPDDQNVAFHNNSTESATMDSLDHLLRSWTWSWDLSKRLRETAKFIQIACLILRNLRSQCEQYIMEARKLREEANAKVFKQSDVLAATVVGAARKIEVIRAARPFAVIVEEACEVMEPTLISVLAVSSLQKLELIGDHRQLPAVVPNCWYTIQLLSPSLQISLFERLMDNSRTPLESIHDDDDLFGSYKICAYTVLDEQRRMRKTIADITRSHYDDVVKILDHSSTATQSIGDKIRTPQESSFFVSNIKSLWHGGGRSVPGIDSCLYFWDLIDGKESKSSVGLSTCNPKEASLAVDLIRYLLLCGVPKASISIITPYKGQKMLISSELRKLQNLNVMENDGDITISTVDRYQGDENDIVIFSLVKSEPGNRFVALKNRWIVTTSRARLGFYVIGSSKAVCTMELSGTAEKGPKHWRQFVNELNANSVANNDDPYQKKRIGPMLPICCPRHPSSKSMISSDQCFPCEGTWNELLCRELCNFTLPNCGHKCKKFCHLFAVQHTEVCEESVNRPCIYHSNVPLLCYEVCSLHGMLSKALSEFKCELSMHFLLDCQHSVVVPCHKYAKFINNPSGMDVKCDEIVEDFIMSCGHMINRPKCHERKAYEEEAPICNESIRYDRSCGCNVKALCHDIISRRIESTPCKKSKNIPRARCSHDMSCRCHEGQQIVEYWKDHCFLSAEVANGKVLIRHGVSYGPSESKILPKIGYCQALVDYQHACGHITSSIKCDDAFLIASDTIVFQCLHKIEAQLPYCLHQTLIPCWLSGIVTDSSPWNTQESHPFYDATGQTVILERYVTENMTPLASDVSSVMRSCCRYVKIRRNCRFQHDLVISCNNLVELMMGLFRLPPCEYEVDKSLKCGHTIKVRCFSFDSDSPLCRELIMREYYYGCGEHSVMVDQCYKYENLSTTQPMCPQVVQCYRYRCNHLVCVPCGQRDQVNICQLGKVLSQENDVIEANENYCMDVLPEPCKFSVRFRRYCGHIMENILCHQAFQQALNEVAAPPCNEIVVIQSPLCHHFIRVPCYLRSSVESWIPWDKPPQFEEVILDASNESVRTIDSLNIRKLVTYSDISKANPPPNVLSQYLQCDSCIVFLRECGHTCIRSCFDTFFNTLDECYETETQVCHRCEFALSMPCSRRIKQGFKCENRVKQLCSECGINIVQAKCSQELIQCKSKVICVRTDCGHSYSWRCGSDRHPNEGDLCLACTLPSWQSALDFCAPYDVCSIEWSNHLNGIVEQGFLHRFKIKARENIPISRSTYGKFIAARKQLLSQNLDALIDQSSSRVYTPPSLWPDGDDRGDFHIVFTAMERAASNDQLSKEFINQKNTNFGFGAELRRFQSSSLDVFSGLRIPKDGCLRLVVGLAYTYRMLSNSTNFTPGNKQKDKDRANQIARNFKSKGFDCVSVPNSSSVVYWIPGSVIPIVKVTIEIHVTCVICMERLLPHQAVRCGEDHFICSNECFPRYVDSVGQVDVVGKVVDRDGHLLCPQCHSPYQLFDIALCASSSIMNLLVKLQITIRERIAADEAAKMEAIRQKAEFDRILSMEVKQRDIELVRMDIIENILTLRCPRCKRAFIDFEGCFALTCADSTCKAAFCAWCLTDCGSNAHSHVLQCSHNQRRDYYGTVQEFSEHHRMRRQQLVQQRLAGYDTEKREAVKKRLQQEFRDLNIRI